MKYYLKNYQNKHCKITCTAVERLYYSNSTTLVYAFETP